MKLRFWRRQEPEPEPDYLDLVDISMDAKERESLFRLLHLLDGIDLGREEKPLRAVNEAARIMAHFQNKRVVLNWDVHDLKRRLHEYEKSIGNAV